MVRRGPNTKMRSDFIDKTGMRFGKLLVLAFVAHEPDKYRKKWRVRCDCGTEKVVWATSLRKRHAGAKSCGSSVCMYGPIETNNPIVTCGCGCGGQLRQFGPKDKRHRKPLRFLRTHGLGRRRWSEKDELELRRLYRTMSVDDLAKRFNRSARGIYDWAYQNGMAASIGAPKELREWETGQEIASRHGKAEKWVKQALAFSGIRAGRSEGRPGERRTNLRVDPRAADVAISRYEAALSIEPMAGDLVEWSAAEERILRSLGGRVPHSTISVVLWRRLETVGRKAKSMGLSAITSQWAGDPRQVLAAMSEGEIHRSEIAAITSLPVRIVSSALNRLRNRGEAVSVGGGRWKLAPAVKTKTVRKSRRLAYNQSEIPIDRLCGGE